MGIKELSGAQCILLAAALASDSNIDSLYKLTPARQDVFSDLELLLRLLLTCLPESLEPAKYTTYLHEISTRVYLKQHEEFEVDCNAVESLSDAEVEQKLKKLHLLQLHHPSIAEGAIQDPFVVFLIHRAHKIDEETGLLPFVPALLEPFLDRSRYLRDWFISAVLPLSRLEFVYYPMSGEKATSLAAFEQYANGEGTDILLSRTLQSARAGTATDKTIGRDFRGILGPWIHGSSQRKRRKLHQDRPLPPIPIGQTQEEQQHNQDSKPQFADKIDDWQPAFRWIVDRAEDEFHIAVKVVEGWSGPIDVDLGGYQKGWRLDQKDDELADELTKEYCQSAFASIYAAHEDTPEVLDGAHAILVRLANLLNFEPPPDLATSIHLLPKVDVHSDDLKSASIDSLQSKALLAPQNPLTIPKLETFSLLQMLVYSAYQLNSLGQKVCVSTMAKVRFWSDASEQLKLVDKILHGLTKDAKRTDEQWKYIRDTLLWLWDWAIDDDSGKTGMGAGIFGKVRRKVVERRILETMCEVGLFSLVVRTYLEKSEGHESPLPKSEVELAIVRLVLQYYDNASNGNKTRGGVKKAADLIAAFRQHFPDSQLFRKCSALIAATHAMSFYSLALQHGVPFQPVSIRVSEDPLSLVAKILEQNQKSYTKLDDLVDIGKNLVIGRIDDDTLSTNEAHSTQDARTSEAEEDDIHTASRRVIGMAIEAALAEDDFETAYSYVVNRLAPPPQTATTTTTTTTTPPHSTPPDDISWRAALAAGKYRFPTTTTTSSTSSRTQIHRLSQRMDLLSHALLLAPPGPALPEVLATWRRCEEELLAARERESEEDAAHDSAADFSASTASTRNSSQKRQNGVGSAAATGTLPGAFTATSEPGLLAQPSRREIGMGRSGAAEEAPMGLFDVARGAAAALQRSTGGLGGLRAAAGGLGAALPHASAAPGRSSEEGERGNVGYGEGQGHGQGQGYEGGSGNRVRKRDMVASAVTGGLASGLGWVLGATPVGEQDRR